MFSENSPSYELPPCCDVMGLSNLITVPDWYRAAGIWGDFFIQAIVDGNTQYVSFDRASKQREVMHYSSFE